MNETQNIFTKRRRSNFHIVPNIADDELDLYEYRLYGHYVRVCGEQSAACHESTRATAAACGFSAGAVAQVRRRLAEKGYIRLHEAADLAGQKRVVVELLDDDIWQRNGADQPKKKGLTTSPAPTPALLMNTPASVVNTPALLMNTLPPENAQQDHKDHKDKDMDKTTTNMHEANGGGGGDSPTPVCDKSIDPLRAFATLLITTMTPAWNAHQSYLAGLDDAGVARLNTWLWIMRLQAYHGGMEGAWIANRIEAAYSKTFAGVANHVAFIRAKVARGEGAWLDSQDVAALQHAIQAGTLDLVYPEPDRVEAANIEPDPEPEPEPVAQQTQTDQAVDPVADVWTQVLADLAISMSPATFNTWVKGATVYAVDGSTWWIAAPNAHALDWLNNRLSNKVRRSLSAMLNQAVAVEFCLPEATP